MPMKTRQAVTSTPRLGVTVRSFPRAEPPEDPRRGIAQPPLGDGSGCTSPRLPEPRSASRVPRTLFALLLAAVALPAMACPPGHYPIGGGTSGWTGCAPMDGGVGDGNNAPSIEDMDVTAPGLSTYDAKAWTDFFEHMAQQTIEQERSSFPPEKREIYDALLRGTWLFSKSRPGADVPTCIASFHTRRGGLMLLDWGGSEPGTVFALFGDGIPRRGRVERVRVRLEQSGEVQEVEAFHSNYPYTHGLGMVMLRVPSTQALLSSIEDVQDYALQMDKADLHKPATLIGRLRAPRGPSGEFHPIPVMQNRWHSGLTARDHLAACVREQGR